MKQILGVVILFFKNLGSSFDFLKIWGVGIAVAKPFCEIFHRLSRNITPPKSFLVRCVERENF